MKATPCLSGFAFIACVVIREVSSESGAKYTAGSEGENEMEKAFVNETFSLGLKRKLNSLLVPDGFVFVQIFPSNMYCFLRNMYRGAP